MLFRSEGVYSRDWVDIGGELMPRQRLLNVTAAVEGGEINDIKSFSVEMEKVHEAVQKDEWLWVKNAYREVFGRDPERLTKDELVQSAESYARVRIRFLKQVLVDAGKEFDELSRTGFGHNGSAEEVEEDFRQVRGRYDEDEFVKEIRDNIEAVKRRVSEFKGKISTIHL